MTKLYPSNKSILDALIDLTRNGDTIIGIYNMTAGQPDVGSIGRYNSFESPLNIIDNDITTKYLNSATRGPGNQSEIDNKSAIFMLELNKLPIL